MSTKPELLFTAPHAFLGVALDEALAGHQVTFREVWTADELPPSPGAVAWIPNPGQHFVIDEPVLARYPALRAVVTPSTGTNHIDLAAAAARDIVVRGLLDDRASLEAISASAEFTFLLLLNALRRLDVGMAEVAAGRWRRAEDELRGHELDGRRVGLVGYGRIGRRMHRYLDAFGARVTVLDPYVPAPTGAGVAGSLDELFGGNDIVVVCCVLTDETRAMVRGEHLSLLPAGGILVNTSRGEVLDEPSVAATLRQRGDLTFTCDVLAGEVRGEQYASPLLDVAPQRVVVTPHIAGATVESQRKAAVAAIKLLDGIVKGH